MTDKPDAKPCPFKSCCGGHHEACDLQECAMERIAALERELAEANKNADPLEQGANAVKTITSLHVRAEAAEADIATLEAVCAKYEEAFECAKSGEVFEDGIEADAKSADLSFAEVYMAGRDEILNQWQAAISRRKEQ